MHDRDDYFGPIKQLDANEIQRFFLGDRTYRRTLANVGTSESFLRELIPQPLEVLQTGVRMTKRVYRSWRSFFNNLFEFRNLPGGKNISMIVN